MPRVRKPNAEVTAQDRQIVAGAALAMRAVAARHHNERLLLAAELATDFVDTPPEAPKPRVRKPKAAPQVVEEEHPFLGPLLHHGA